MIVTLHDPGGLSELSALFELRNENKRLREMRGLDHNGPGSGGGAMVKWLLGIVAGLALAGVLGGIAMYRENGQLEAAIGENARRMDRIENEINRRFERLENYVYRERR